MKAILVSLGAILALLALLVTQYEGSGPAIGSAPPGLSAGTSTESIVLVGSTSPVTIFETRPNCLARAISTASTTIMISFGSSTPTASNGYWMTSSSSVTFDGGEFGCGNWSAYGFERSSSVPSSTITVIQFQ